jgi:hypothetical protein
MFKFERVDGRLRLVQVPGWQLALIVAVVLAIGVTLAVVAVGVFLVVFPAILIGGAVYQLFRKMRARSAADRRAPPVIEAEYRVIDDGSRPDRDNR